MRSVFIVGSSLFFTSMVILGVFSEPSLAQGLAPEVVERSLLKDNNGDGEIRIIAFGDSLTRGTGDFTEPNEEVEIAFQPTTEAGYPLRVETLLGVSVQNLGVPGEDFSGTGIARFASEIPSSRADLVLISEGANDSRLFLSPQVYFRTLQAAVNIAKASGAQPIVGTIIPACCGKAGLTPFIDTYNVQVRRVAEFNQLSIFDPNQAFINNCPVREECRLLNRPEGLHPNIDGYDVIGEVVAAALLKIELFAADGAARLEAALGLPAGSVRTKPSA